MILKKVRNLQSYLTTEFIDYCVAAFDVFICNDQGAWVPFVGKFEKDLWDEIELKLDAKFYVKEIRRL